MVHARKPADIIAEELRDHNDPDSAVEGRRSTRFRLVPTFLTAFQALEQSDWRLVFESVMTAFDVVRHDTRVFA